MSAELKHPIISVIVPVYNISKYDLNRSIMSIINNTFRNIEVLVIDDCSDKDTADECDAISKLDACITIVHLPENKGAYSARNIGLSLAKGDYIFFADPDDYISENTFKVLLGILEENMLDLAIGSVQRVTTDGNFIHKIAEEFKGKLVWNKEEIEKIRLGMLERYKVSLDDVLYFETADFPVEKLYKKKIIEKYKLLFPNVRSGEDRLFNYIYLYYCNTVGYTTECVYYYTDNPKSTTHVFSQKKIDNTTAVLTEYKKAIEIFDINKERYLDAYYRRCIWASYLMLDGYFYHQDNKGNGMYEKYVEMIQEPVYQDAIRNVHYTEIARGLNRIEVILLKKRLYRLAYIWKNKKTKSCIAIIYDLYDKTAGRIKKG